MVAMVVVNVIALAVNLAGVADPNFLTTMEVRDLGFIKLAPSALWFLGALAFMAIFCVCVFGSSSLSPWHCTDNFLPAVAQIPCIAIAVANVCTFRPRRPEERGARWRFARRVPEEDEEALVGLPTVRKRTAAQTKTKKRTPSRRHEHHKTPSERKRDGGPQRARSRSSIELAGTPNPVLAPVPITALGAPQQPTTASTSSLDAEKKKKQPREEEESAIAETTTRKDAEGDDEEILKELTPTPVFECLSTAPDEAASV